MDDNQFNENTQYNPDGQGYGPNNGGQQGQYGSQQGGYQQGYQQGNYQQGYQQSYQQGGYQQGGYQPGGYQPQAAPPPGLYKPESGLVWGILTTIFCCLPFGIVSIVYATKVDSMWYMGNYQAAMDYAKKAKNWAMWAAISAAVVLILYFVLIAVGIGFGAHKSGLWDF